MVRQIKLRLTQLNATWKEVRPGHYFCEVHTERLGECTGCPLGTVKMRVVRGGKSSKSRSKDGKMRTRPSKTDGSMYTRTCVRESDCRCPTPPSKTIKMVTVFT